MEDGLKGKIMLAVLLVLQALQTLHELVFQLISYPSEEVVDPENGGESDADKGKSFFEHDEGDDGWGVGKGKVVEEEADEPLEEPHFRGN